MESAGERNACRCVRSPDCMTAELRSWLIRGGMSMTDENREDDAAHHPKTRLSPCLQAARKACHAVSCFAIHAYRLNPRLSPSSCPHMTRDEEPARDESRAPPGLNLHACPQCVQPWRHDARRSAAARTAAAKRCGSRGSAAWLRTRSGGVMRTQRGRLHSRRDGSPQGLASSARACPRTGIPPPHCPRCFFFFLLAACRHLRTLRAISLPAIIPRGMADAWNLRWFGMRLGFGVWFHPSVRL